MTNDTQALLERLRHRGGDGLPAADTIEALTIALAAAERERDSLIADLRAKMIAQPLTGEPGGNKYTDGYAMGLATAIDALRAAIPAKQEPSQ